VGKGGGGRVLFPRGGEKFTVSGGRILMNCMRRGLLKERRGLSGGESYLQDFKPKREATFQGRKGETEGRTR